MQLTSQEGAIITPVSIEPHEPNTRTNLRLLTSPQIPIPSATLTLKTHTRASPRHPPTHSSTLTRRGASDKHPTSQNTFNPRAL